MTHDKSSQHKSPPKTLTAGESDFLDFLDSVDKDALEKEAEEQIAEERKKATHKRDRDLGTA